MNDNFTAGRARFHYDCMTVNNFFFSLIMQNNRKLCEHYTEFLKLKKIELKKKIQTSLPCYNFILSKFDKLMLSLTDLNKRDS